jgi:Xaa-Pro aminopeptidase
VLREGYDAAVAAIRPGILSSELHETTMEVFRRQGFAAGGGHFGHGLGLDVAEGVSVEPGDPIVLAAGMVLVLHPKIVPAAGDPQLLLGGTFLVTDDGCESLNDVDLFEV